MRDSGVYIRDILDSIKKIEEFTQGYTYQSFIKNALVTDAVIRNPEIIGEAIKKIPSESKKKHPEIEWKKIVGLRDILIHGYFNVKLEIVWDLITQKVPELKKVIEKIEKEE